MQAGPSEALTQGALRRSDALPSLHLRDMSGAAVLTRDFYARRNLVLFFLGDVRCDACRRLLGAIAGKYNDIRGEETEVLAVAPGSAGEVRGAMGEMRLPFPVLIDEEGEARRRVGAGDAAGRPVAAVLIVDRFGEVYEARYEDEAHRLMDEDEIVRSLRFIEVQCPECGAPEWPLVEERSGRRSERGTNGAAFR